METTINYNGTEIILSGEYVGTARPWGEEYLKQHHEVSVWVGDKHVEFNFYCNDPELGEDGLREAFYCFLSDGIAYRNAKDKYDFADEFGYDKYEDRKRLNEVWQGCMSAYDKWSQFGIDIYEITNWLQETYDL